jgi:glutamine synthetase
MAIFAANSNAYKRYVPNIFVPTTQSWGKENRSVAVRIPRSDGAARRIEHRVAGADANPYLLLAALLAGIHNGITGNLQPGQQAYGNASDKLSAYIPFDIDAGLQKIRQSEILKRYMGKKYIDAYAECKRLEYQAFKDRKVEDETCWYL